MEARLYELIRDYQEDRMRALGSRDPEFRVQALDRFARARLDRYPEYVLEDGRLARAVAQARATREILPLPSGARDEPLRLRIDCDGAI